LNEPQHQSKDNQPMSSNEESEEEIEEDSSLTRAKLLLEASTNPKTLKQYYGQLAFLIEYVFEHPRHRQHLLRERLRAMLSLSGKPLRAAAIQIASDKEPIFSSLNFLVEPEPDAKGADTNVLGFAVFWASRKRGHSTYSKASGALSTVLFPLHNDFKPRANFYSKMAKFSVGDRKVSAKNVDQGLFGSHTKTIMPWPVLHALCDHASKDPSGTQR
jgi:hypothetical protein